MGIVLSRKGLLALVGILVAALVGAFASSMISSGGFQLKNLLLESSTGESFMVFADEIIVDGLDLGIDELSGVPVIILQNARVNITNQCVRKVEGGKTLEINASRAIGSEVTMKVTRLTSDEADFVNLMLWDLPSFGQNATRNVLTNVEITTLYLFAESMTLYDMEINIS